MLMSTRNKTYVVCCCTAPSARVRWHGVRVVTRVRLCVCVRVLVTVQPWDYVSFIVYLRLKRRRGEAFSGVEQYVWDSLSSSRPTAWFPVSQALALGQ